MNTKQGPIVVIGGGQAGGMVVKKLVGSGYTGPITLVCGEQYLPYERPPLSKHTLLQDENETNPVAPILGDSTRANHYGLNIRLETHATKIDRNTHTVWLDNGETAQYERLIIATGGTPRKLTYDDDTIKGLHYLRTFDDAQLLRSRLKTAESVMIIGGGWIGLEVAASARTLGKNVVVLESDNQLCRRSLPTSVAKFLASFHEQQGVDIRFCSQINGIIKNESSEAIGVTLADGSTLFSDLIVVGIGLVPNTLLAKESGLTVRSGILVDTEGRTTDPHIYAVGDVAERECMWHQSAVRLESWHNANVQAGLVAASILGQPIQDAALPWFWSEQYGLNLQVLGVPGLADTVVERESGADSLLNIYLKQQQICGVISINKTRELKLLERAMLKRRIVRQDALQNSQCTVREALLNSP